LAVPSYTGFAEFYDAVMGDPTGKIELISDWIRQHAPQARSLLELGCGTGSVLTGLADLPSLTGIDLSPRMLEIARIKVPRAQLVEADMASFALQERFDVAVCVFDTINHLDTFDAWKDLFERVHEHLVEHGLFIFDVNTIGKLRALGNAPPWVHDFDRNVLIMNVEFDGQQMSIWDVRVFQHLNDRQFLLHHERIGELGVPLGEIRAALRDDFEVVDEHDPDGTSPTDESRRVYFVCRRKPGLQS
jgi:SAM-dependent methyltransferase